MTEAEGAILKCCADLALLQAEESLRRIESDLAVRRAASITEIGAKGEYLRRSRERIMALVAELERAVWAAWPP